MSRAIYYFAPGDVRMGRPSCSFSNLQTEPKKDLQHSHQRDLVTRTAPDTPYDPTQPNSDPNPNPNPDEGPAGGPLPDPHAAPARAAGAACVVRRSERSEPARALRPGLTHLRGRKNDHSPKDLMRSKPYAKSLCAKSSLQQRER